MAASKKVCIVGVFLFAFYSLPLPSHPLVFTRAFSSSFLFPFNTTIRACTCVADINIKHATFQPTHSYLNAQYRHILIISVQSWLSNHSFLQVLARLV